MTIVWMFVQAEKARYSDSALLWLDDHEKKNTFKTNWEKQKHNTQSKPRLSSLLYNVVFFPNMLNLLKLIESHVNLRLRKNSI